MPTEPGWPTAPPSSTETHGDAWLGDTNEEGA